jgi:uroporphyrinogen decarboxylase
MKMNMNDWLQGILTAEEKFGLPITSYPCLPLTGHTMHQVLNDPQANYELIHANVKRFPLPVAQSLIDLTMEAEAFGAKIDYTKTGLPTIVEEPVSDRKSIENLKVPEVGDARTHVFLKAAELAVKNIDSVPFMPIPIGPFSLASSLIGLNKMFRLILKEKETAHILLEKATEYALKFAKEYKRIGANGMVIAEPTAGLLSPEQMDEFSSKYVRRIVDALQDEMFIVLLHNCGFVDKSVASMVSTGVRGYSFGNVVKMEEIMPQIPEDQIVMGNLDPSGVFNEGTPEFVEEMAKDLLGKVGGYKNFVLASGCDLSPTTPLENIDAFYEALQEYNDSKK